MNWFHRLEGKFGHLAIPGLIRVVVMFNVLCYILATLQPEYVRFLELKPERVLHVPRDNPWLARDIDTPADLAEARHAAGGDESGTAPVPARD